MRLLVDCLFVVILCSVLCVLVIQRCTESRQMNQVGSVQMALGEIYTQATYKMSIQEVGRNQRGHPQTISPEWFNALPVNILADSGSPWIDIAGEDQRLSMNPVRVITSGGGGGGAAFWYNPGTGVLRARVAQQITDHQTVELYNLVNGTKLIISDLWRVDTAQVDTE